MTEAIARCWIFADLEMEGSENGLLPTLNVLDPFGGVKTILKWLNFAIFSFLRQGQAQSLLKKLIRESIRVTMAELWGLRYSNYHFWSKKTPPEKGGQKLSLTFSFIYFEEVPYGIICSKFQLGVSSSSVWKVQSSIPTESYGAIPCACTMTSRSLYTFVCKHK